MAEIDYAEALLVEQGDCVHVVNGRERSMEEGMLTLIRPGDRHGFRYQSEAGFTNLIVQFPRETLEAMRDRYFSKSKDFFGAGQALPPVFRLTPDEKSVVLRAMTELASEPQGAFPIDRFLMNLFHLLYRRGERTAESQMPVWLRSAQTWMRDPRNFTKGLPQFIRLCGRSGHHVAREMKKWTGQKPAAFLNDVRLDYAARQLEHGEETLDDILIACGYRSRSYFFRVFKRRFGVTPSAYRARHHVSIPTYRTDPLVRGFGSGRDKHA